jgi:gliding motility-associated-like protein
LHASGGSTYTWSPSSFLTNINIPDPISVKPTLSIRYIVAVRDTFGCPKPSFDTVFVTVAKIVADAGPRDTSVVLTQPVQLSATGSTNYLWTPNQWLDNNTIATPIATPQETIEYVVKVSNDAGCFATDTILVKLFKVDPDLYVPTAFSPDGDGLNDDFKPILIGMKSLDIFHVYNRWGQLIFQTTQHGKGWDGKFAGQPQSAGTYVWRAEGTTYLNKKIVRKGSVILIR